MLILDLGQHDLILGRKWFELYDIWIDPRNRRLIWPNERSLFDEAKMNTDLVVDRRALMKPPPNPAHQADANRRDKATEEEDKQIQILKRNPTDTP